MNSKKMLWKFLKNTVKVVHLLYVAWYMYYFWFYQKIFHNSSISIVTKQKIIIIRCTYGYRFINFLLGTGIVIILHVLVVRTFKTIICSIVETWIQKLIFWIYGKFLYQLDTSYSLELIQNVQREKTQKIGWNRKIS